MLYSHLTITAGAAHIPYNMVYSFTFMSLSLSIILFFLLLLMHAFFFSYLLGACCIKHLVNFGAFRCFGVESKARRSTPSATDASRSSLAPKLRRGNFPADFPAFLITNWTPIWPACLSVSALVLGRRVKGRWLMKFNEVAIMEEFFPVWACEKSSASANKSALVWKTVGFRAAPLPSETVAVCAAN